MNNNSILSYCLNQKENGLIDLLGRSIVCCQEEKRSECRYSQVFSTMRTDKRSSKKRSKYFHFGIVLFLAISPLLLMSQSCSDGSYSFIDDIAPILNSRCAGCHGNSSGFNVSTYANVQAGGNNCGPGFTPFDASATASSLIDKLQWAIGGPNASCGNNMPLSGGPLTSAQFTAIQTWIMQGAQEECPPTNSNCPPDYTFNGNGGLTGTESGMIIYETDGIIESTQTIAATAVVDYNSAIEINLLEGFETILGAQFHAFIDGCP